MGYSPRGQRESDTTERSHFHFTVSYNLTIALNQNMTFLRTGLFLKRDICDLFKIKKANLSILAFLPGIRVIPGANFFFEADLRETSVSGFH